MGLYEDSKLVRLGKGKPYLHDNVLHQFASYNTIFTLSGISEKEMRAQKYLTNPVHEIIARTGGIGGNANVQTKQFEDANEDYSVLDREGDMRRYKERYSGSISILERAHDLFIENVNMISTASPGSERGLGNFTKIEFEIHEPYGVTFVEKVHAATAINGYKDYQDAPLLLTIEFKGLDENGREVKTKPVIRKIPIGIARVEFDVNEGGARYSIIAVPYPELGYDDRYKYPRCDVPVAADSPLEWARDVESVLATQMEKEIEEKKREIPDVYKFEIDKAVLDFAKQYALNESNANVSGKAEGIDLGQQEGLTDAGTPQKTVIKKVSGTAGDTTSLIKFFEDAIRQSTGYKKLAESFWTTYLTSIGVDPSKLVTDEAKLKYMEGSEFTQKLIQNQYVDWFKIKTTVYTDIERFDNITKMHPKTIIYRAVPCKVHILRMVTAGISIAGIDWGRQVHKEYNYIYTGANVDVQNLRINYKTAYYLRNVRGDDKSFAEDGLFSWAKKAAKNVFGREKYPEPIKPLRSYPSNIKGRNTLEDGDTSGNQRSQEFYDYLTNPEADMIKIELEILGDPAFICQDSFLNVKPDGTVLDTFRTTFSREYESFNSDSFQPIINVVYRIPDDLDELEGTMFSGDKYRDENLFFNGLYQVNKIESRFDNGQFLQTLFCSRFNNQQGLGKNPLVSDVISDTNKLINTKIKVEDLEAKARTAKGILEAEKLKDIQDIVESLNE